MSQFYTAADHFAILPGILLAFFGCALLLVDVFVLPDRRQKRSLLVFVLIALGFTAAQVFRQHAYFVSNGNVPLTAFGGAVTVDGFSIFFNWLFIASTLLVTLVSYRFLEIEDEHQGEYYGMLLLAQCGMYFLACGTELTTLFVALELMALSFYILVGFLRRDRRSSEAALKYFLLGGLSTGFMLYGFSILYALSGSTKLRAIRAALENADTSSALVILAVVTTSVGLLFKIAAVPFHMWAPDAYEGAPTPITAHLSVASKAASFALLVRIFTEALPAIRQLWEPMLAVIAVLTMTIGNLAAITQTSVKRLLAYSSIAHAGYMLLGLVAGNQTGLKGLAVYLLTYVFMNIGAFLVIVGLRRGSIHGEQVSDLAGLARHSPGYAAWMAVFLLSLAGVPPTAGFIAKYYIFLGLVETGHYILAAIGVLYVAVAVYYYFRIVRSMYLDPSAEEPAPIAASMGMSVALGVSAALTIGIGVYPEPFLKLAGASLLR
jgi:NADH-quinone oxidoreductase subunit N